MYRGTTPTICFSIISSLDIGDAAEIWLTISMVNKKLMFTKDRITVDAKSKKIYVTLTQEETLSLGTGTAKAQVRILMKDGSAFATDVVNLTVDGILTDGEINDGDSDESGGGDSGDSDESGGT